MIRFFWSELKRQKLPQRSIRNTVIDLLLTAARYTGDGSLGYYIGYLKRIEEIETMKEPETLVEQCCGAEVARSAGFVENTRYFCQVFRKSTGRSPAEYRRQAGPAS